MGNKTDITTIEGLRKTAHAAIDNFFNRLRAKPDGTPVDKVDMEHTRQLNKNVPGESVVALGEAIGFGVEYAKPHVMLAKGEYLTFVTPEGRFRLLDPVAEANDVLIAFLAEATSTEHTVMLNDLLGGIVPGLTMSISEVMRRTNLVFERVGDFAVEHSVEEDGRNIAEIPRVPGAMAYGDTPEEAEAKARAIAEEELKAQGAPPLTGVEDVKKFAADFKDALIANSVQEPITEGDEGTSEADIENSKFVDLDEKSQEEYDEDRRQAKQAIDDEIEALRTKADARALAELHKVNLDETADKLADMKDALRTALITET